MTHQFCCRPYRDLVCLLVVALGGLLPAVSVGEFSAQKAGLTFEHAPEVIQAKARDGKFLSVTLYSKPVSWAEFNRMVREKNAAGVSVFGIGVIVNARSEDWPNDETTAHIGMMKKKVDEILRGNSEIRIVGFAEKFGVRVNAIVPVIYEPGEILRHGRKGDIVETPLSLDSILLAINDHGYAYRQGDTLISSPTELRLHMEERLSDGKHLVTAAEYFEQLEEYLQLLADQIAKLDEEIAEGKAGLSQHDAVIERLDGQIIEMLLIKGLTDFLDGRGVSRTFLPSTSEGRENRRTIENYFGKQALEIDKDFDVFVLLDTYQVYANGLFRRGCDAGDAESCRLLAFNYCEGTGIEQDGARAAQLYRQACEMGLARACDNVNTPSCSISPGALHGKGSVQ